VTRGTQATAIAALEARRNEEETLAAGALEGERRASWARLAMVILFAFSAQVLPVLQGEPHDAELARKLVGLSYTLFAVSAIVILRRARPNVRHVRVRPMLVTVLDFSFITFMGLSDVRTGLGYRPELGAIAGAVLISFAIARYALWQVLVTVALAIASFATVAIRAGRIGESTTIFVLCGFAALGVMVALTNRAVRRMFTDLRRRDNLTRFLPRPVAERVMAHGARALAPVQREVTVLFSDIRGFTALSETLPPRAVLELLDDYFGRMALIVKGHDGVVGKFLGDGMLAFWNVPDRDPDHAAKAVRAALDMQRELTDVNRVREAEGLAPLRIGVGIHTGPVAAGMLGGAEHAEYTVIGDAVNVASRIEGLTKQHDVALLVSETTWSRCGDRFDGRRLDAEEIRGRREAVVLYAVASS
jgi:adenylate cyclase